jgi:hypothetical protein
MVSPSSASPHTRDTLRIRCPADCGSRRCTFAPWRPPGFWRSGWIGGTAPYQHRPVRRQLRRSRATRLRPGGAGSQFNRLMGSPSLDWSAVGKHG